MINALPDNAMPLLLLAGFRGLVDELHARLAERGFADVRAIHGVALQALGGGCTSAELGRRLGVSKQAAAKTAQALESLGFVSREANPQDRRERRLVPTGRGLEMLTESGRILSELVGGWRLKVGDRDVETTLKTLATVNHGDRGMTDISDWF